MIKTNRKGSCGGTPRVGKIGDKKRLGNGRGRGLASASKATRKRVARKGGRSRNR